MKKFIICIYFLIILVISKLIFSFIINEKFISRYNNGDYNKNSIKPLFVLNIFEPCVAHYNYGNLFYQNQDYDSAIKEYKEALKLFHSKNQECSIRINLTLSLLKKIDFNAEVDEILNELNNAKSVLCEKGCANLNDDNGHSKEAEKLKSDIDREIDRLKNKSSSTQDNKEDNKEEDNNDSENKKSNQIKEKLKQIQQQSLQKRQDELNNFKGLEEYEYYNGKKW